MPGRRVSVLDVEELVRRLRCGQRVRAITRDLGIDRKTVRRYRDAALERGWMTGEMPALEVINEVVGRSDRRPDPYHG